MDDDRQGIHQVAIEQQVQPDQGRGAVFQEVVVEGGVSAADRFQPVVEVEDDLRQRQFVLQGDPGRVEVFHGLVDATPVPGQFHDIADVVVRDDDLGLDERLFHGVDVRGIRHVGRVVHHEHFAGGGRDPVLHARHGGQDREPVFPFEPLLHDFHVEQSEESAAKAESQGYRSLGFIHQGGVVQLVLLEGFLQRFVIFRSRRVEPAEHHGFGLPVPGQRFVTGPGGVGDRVAHAGVGHVADIPDQIADLPGRERIHGRLVKTEHAGFGDFELLVVGTHPDMHARLYFAAHDAYVGHRATVLIEDRIEDESPQGTVVGFRGRDTVQDGLQHRFDPDSVSRAGQYHVFGVDAQQIHDLARHDIDPRVGQIDLVDDRDDGEVVLQGQVQIADRLRLDALYGVHDQERAFTGREAPGNLVGKIDVSGGIDQIQRERPSVRRIVGHADRVGLDRDAPLPLQVEIIEHLGTHLQGRYGARHLQQPIRQRRFAVIDMRDDGEVANVFRRHVKTARSSPKQRNPPPLQTVCNRVK